MCMVTIREDGAMCYGANLDDEHGDTCYCGRPATRHVYYGTGCGNVCGIHARKILRIKHKKPEPPNLIVLTKGSRG
jgi:hypothetical protein